MTIPTPPPASASDPLIEALTMPRGTPQDWTHLPVTRQTAEAIICRLQSHAAVVRENAELKTELSRIRQWRESFTTKPETVALAIGNPALGSGTFLANAARDAGVKP